MAHYRLYFVQKNHFTGVEAIEAEDDDLALLEAQRLYGNREAELWCQGRRVHKFQPEVGRGEAYNRPGGVMSAGTGL